MQAQQRFSRMERARRAQRERREHILRRRMSVVVARDYQSVVQASTQCSAIARSQSTDGALGPSGDVRS
jgi:hypothetical protein